MSEMRAARYDRYGPPEVLYEGTLPKPVAGPGEVLVRVHATSVNGGELSGRAGKMKLVTGRKFPQGTGVDIAGEIAEVGSSVRHLAVGERVWGTMPHFRFGAAAEYVAVRPRQLSYAPEGIDLVRAAALPGVGTTAITALRDKIGLMGGERLLVRGAAGGVGSVAVQLGHALGAHVTALAGAKALDFVRELGADEAHDYRTTGPADLGPFDAVLDTVGTELGAYRGLLAPGGRMVAIAFDTDRPLSSLGAVLLSTVHGARRVRFFSGNPLHQLFADLAAYVENGAIRPVVDTVHPLSDIAKAHRAMEAGGVRGKHVIQVK
ncbi:MULTISPECIES: NAD(P)-dependent alcohol dehydrogenase [unclassified Streptomyces]|uniref:NAD(P)-dependent alcohol dehydrogenase n=1 Tax=unclassified Streptomyces TaxID=2593676 RepID=UPI00168B13AE|nr:MULTISPECIES: NAD(P)-dependent alcohol dehydrogenase [unclassified Streptomyces]MBD3002980.1 NAD(P)-dependent alcohol dehydrogenase [Streptomyces sp. 5-10]